MILTGVCSGKFPEITSFAWIQAQSLLLELILIRTPKIECTRGVVEGEGATFAHNSCKILEHQEMYQIIVKSAIVEFASLDEKQQIGDVV